MQFYLLLIHGPSTTCPFRIVTLFESREQNLSALNLNSLPYFCRKLLKTCIKKENIGAWHGLYFLFHLLH